MSAKTPTGNKTGGNKAQSPVVPTRLEFPSASDPSAFWLAVRQYTQDSPELLSPNNSNRDALLSILQGNQRAIVARNKTDTSTGNNAEETDGQDSAQEEENNANAGTESDLDTKEKRDAWKEKLEQKYKKKYRKRKGSKRKRYYSDSSSSESEEEYDNEYKLMKSYKSYAPDIKKFTGNYVDWFKWKINTKTKLVGMGYSSILDNRRIATKSKVRNNILFTLIHEALEGGTADHIHFNPEKQDGHKLWHDLVFMFEGNPLTTARVLTELKASLQKCVLVPGNTPEAYMNKFRKLYAQIISQPTQFEYNPLEAKQLFLWNIQDPEYAPFVSTNIGTYFHRSLDELMTTFREYDYYKQQHSERVGRRGTRRTKRMKIDGNENNQNSHGKEDTGPSGEKISLSGIVNPNMNGLIKIFPYTDWKDLIDDHKDFVLKYNAAVRLNTELPSPPNGVTIGEPKGGNKSRRMKRVRRKQSIHGNKADKNNDITITSVFKSVYDNEKSKDTEKSTPEDKIDDTDEDEDLDISILPKKRTVRFHMPTNEPETNNTPCNTPSCNTRSKTQFKRPKRRTKTRRVRNDANDKFVIDSGGGMRPTITERAWLRVGPYTGMTTLLNPYQTNTSTEHELVSAVTKAEIPGYDDPVILKVHYATFITMKQDPDEYESLCTTMDLGNHGIKVNVQPNFDDCGMTIEGDFMPFESDHESVFLKISKPTEEELSLYKVYELNANDPIDFASKPRRRKRNSGEISTKFSELPKSELRKIFGLLPERTIEKTLQNTTQYYLDVVEETRTTPHKHFRKRFKALPYNRQHETVSSDYTFFSKKTSQGHKGGQFFSGNTSKKWSFHPTKLESQCDLALEDYIRENGPPIAIKTDNAKSETGLKWIKILRAYMIKSRTTEPHSPHQNFAEPEWGRLSKMVQNNLRHFEAPIGLANWCALYMCQVNNYTARESLNWRTPMEVSSGQTPDISMFRFHFYEPIWFFVPNNDTGKGLRLSSTIIPITSATLC